MWVNPLTIMGMISIPFLISNFATFLGFLLSAYFALSYTRTFYEGRPKPMSWVLLVTGLSTFCVSELGQFLFSYRLEPTALEMIAILIAQNFGVILIAVGSYLIYKEVM